MGFELVLEGGGCIEPGQEIRLGLTVTNTSDVVDEVQLSVLGDAQGWATVHPGSIALFPATTAQATIRVAPPLQGAPAAGPVALGVLARSTEWNTTTVAETTLMVLPAVTLDARLVPVTSYGRRRASHTVVVRNLGNAVAPVSIEATDDDQLLELEVAPRSQQLDPGTEATFNLRLRSLAGRDAPRVPFKVTALSPGTPEAQLVGTFVRRRRPLVPIIMVAALVLALAVAVLLQREDSRAVVTAGSSSAEPTSSTAGGAGGATPDSAPPAASDTAPPGSAAPAPPGDGAPPAAPSNGTPGAQAAPGATTGAGVGVPTPTAAPPKVTQPTIATAGTSSGTCSGDNLVANNSFENGLTGWTVKLGSPRTVAYGQPGYQAQPIDYVESSYAYGGPGSSGVVATLEQLVDLSSCQAAIAGGGKVIHFGGWMGGYLGQQDTVNLVIFFRAGGRTLTETCSLNGPTAADRGGATTMLEIGATPCPVPTAATTAIYQIRFTKDAAGGESDGSYDNAYLYVA